MSLADQLRAFHAAVTGAAPLSSAVSLVRTDGVDPSVRLHVYAHAYVARIAGVLATDFPKLRVLLGAESFDALVLPYLRAHPTCDPSLREAGAQLAGFLDEPRAAELARLERARIEAFDGADATPLSREDVAAHPPEEFPALRLALVPTAAVLELATNADDVWDAIEGDRPVPASEPVPRTVLVWRREITVIHRTLEPDEAIALRRVAGGASFGEICELLAGNANAVDRALALLLRWLDAQVLRA